MGLGYVIAALILILGVGVIVTSVMNNKAEREQIHYEIHQIYEELKKISEKLDKREE